MIEIHKASKSERKEVKGMEERRKSGHKFNEVSESRDRKYNTTEDMKMKSHKHEKVEREHKDSGRMHKAFTGHCELISKKQSRLPGIPKQDHHKDHSKY